MEFEKINLAFGFTSEGDALFCVLCVGFHLFAPF